jgi:hypothetical protein
LERRSARRAGIFISRGMTLPPPNGGHGSGNECERAFCLALLRRRNCLVPTMRGWGLLLVVMAVSTLTVAHGLQTFLAPNDPQSGGVLVAEGWASDYTLAAAAAEFRRNHYEKLYVTGGPVSSGSFFVEYKSAATLGAATLLKMGLAANEVQAVPAALVTRDRTYNSAVCLKRWWREHGIAPAKINLLTEGPHARRSRLLYEKALGTGVTVGVIAVPVQNYDPNHWWRSCSGTRTVLGEAIAYGYARLLFHPGEE